MSQNNFPSLRLRRLRRTENLRKLVQETTLSVNDLIFPLFIKSDNGIKIPISSMPGMFQFGLQALKPEIEEIVGLGIKGVILFGIPESKDDNASISYCETGIVQQAIKTIKDVAPELLVIADVCCCEYTSHGHCGIMNNSTGKIDLDNDATLPIITNQAISFAAAGADIVAPSGMIDGQISSIRKGLDQEGFYYIPILSYSVKYASQMYGPFREAAEGAPKYGDRKTYQMDPANSNEAIREAMLDVTEGADMLMVKPAHTYLDIIYKVKQQWPEVPIAAYHVSGEYSMIMAAAKNGWIDAKKAALEVLTSIKRSGADIIITYFAKDIAKAYKTS